VVYFSNPFFLEFFFSFSFFFFFFFFFFSSDHREGAGGGGFWFRSPLKCTCSFGMTDLSLPLFPPSIGPPLNRRSRANSDIRGPLKPSPLTREPESCGGLPYSPFQPPDALSLRFPRRSSICAAPESRPFSYFFFDGFTFPPHCHAFFFRDS